MARQNDGIGPCKLPSPDSFYPNRRDKAEHDGALKNAQGNVQHVMRFNDSDKATASGSFTSSARDGYSKTNPGSVQQYSIPVQPE